MTLRDFALSSPFFYAINGQNLFVDGEKYITQVNQICLDFFDSYLKNLKEFERI